MLRERRYGKRKEREIGKIKKERERDDCVTKKNGFIKEDEFWKSVIRHRKEKGKRLMQDEQRVTESRNREKL